MHKPGGLLLTLILAGPACAAAGPSPAAAIPLQITAAPGTDTAATEVDEQNLLRRIGFGNRELNLPLQIENDELQLDNDKLENKLAELQDRTPDTDRLAIDQFELDRSIEAVDAAMSFAQAWSKLGTPELQLQLTDLDARFDAANHKCHVRSDRDEHLQYASLEQAQAACADLHAIYLATSAHIAHPAGWSSVFDQGPQSRTGKGFGLVNADTLQLKHDQASHVTPQIKSHLIQDDQKLILADKQVWLLEIGSRDIAQFNQQHPDHLMADDTEIFDMTLKFRNDIAAIDGRFRNAVLGSHQPAKHATQK